MTRRRDLIACSAQRIAGPAAAQSYEWSAEDLVFLSRRVRPTPSGRLTRDVHQCNMCIWLAQGAYAGSYFDGSDWSAIRLVDRPGSQAIDLYVSPRVFQRGAQLICRQALAAASKPAGWSPGELTARGAGYSLVAS
jgi:hypothetical protein